MFFDGKALFGRPRNFLESLMNLCHKASLMDLSLTSPKKRSGHGCKDIKPSTIVAEDVQ